MGEREGYIQKVIHAVVVDLTGKAVLAFLGWIGGLALLSSFLAWATKHILLAMGLPKQPTHIYVLFGILAFCAMALTSTLFLLFIKAFGEFRHKPRLTLTLSNLIWQYRTSDDLTVFFILASLVNSGEPSVAMNWRVKYQVEDSIEFAEIYSIMGSYVVDVDSTRVTFTNENLLNLKTLETPIQKGQFVGGRIFFAVPGNRTEQIKSIRHSIEIECQDYLGKSTKAKYQPSPIPVKTLLSHYKEKREAIKDKGDGEPNAIKQPGSVSYTQEPPSLGDGS